MDLLKDKKPSAHHTNDEKKRAQLKAAILKKKECQAKVAAVVEMLLENPIEKSFFEEKAILIDPAAYQDVVEERAILKTCGYPLCGNQLVHIPKQKFRISMKSNKVYDITDRKNFCCNGCYQASCHIKGQLLTTPVWARDAEETIKLSCLPHGVSSNLVGEEVRLFGRISPKDVEFHSISDTISALADEIDDIVIEDGKKDEKLAENEKKSVRFSENVQVTSETEEIKIDKGRTSENSSEGESKQKGKRKERVERTPKSKSKAQSEEPLLPSLYVEKTLKEWFTVDSIKYIFGSDYVDAVLMEKKQESELANKSVEVDSEQYRKLLERLDKMDEEEGIFDHKINEGNVDTSQPKRPLPSFEKLKKETEEATAKVAAYLSGKMELGPISGGISIKEKPDGSTKDDEKPIFLPPIDSHSQNALRRQIVLNRLHLTIPDLMRTFDLGDVNINDEIRDLAFTFKFSANNIVHEPHHWSLIGLALIYCASKKDERLKIRIEAEPPQKYIKMILMGFNLDPGYLERLLLWLADVTLKSLPQ